MTHICVSKLTIIIGSDSDLWPGRCQATIWTNAGILSIRTLVANFSDILSEIHTFHPVKCLWKWQPFCLSLSVLTGRVDCISRSNTIVQIVWQDNKADSRFAPSQWETVLLCNDISHWLGPSLESALKSHYNDVIMGAIASQVTSFTIVYSIVYSGADQRKHQSSGSLAFVWGI